jgi:hypothetical protein
VRSACRRRTQPDPWRLIRSDRLFHPQSGGLAAIGKQALLTMQIWSED